MRHYGLQYYSSHCFIAQSYNINPIPPAISFKIPSQFILSFLSSLFCPPSITSSTDYISGVISTQVYLVPLFVSLYAAILCNWVKASVIYLLLSDLLHIVWYLLIPFNLKQRENFIFSYTWIVSHCIYVPSFLYLHVLGSWVASRFWLLQIVLWGT